MMTVRGLVHIFSGHELVEPVKILEIHMPFFTMTGMENINQIAMLICVQTILVTVRY